MANLVTSFMLWLCLISYAYTTIHAAPEWPRGRSTRFYDFKIQTMTVNKLCNSKQIVTVNNMFPGPVVYAQQGDRLIVKVSNESPYNATIHWATVYGALVVYPKPGVPYPFKYPYEEHIVILGEYWLQDIVQLERQVVASVLHQQMRTPLMVMSFIIHPLIFPGANSEATRHETIDVYKITYLLRLINAGLNMESFFAIANHKLTIVEADAEYTKPFTTDRVMLGPGQTMIVLVTADQTIGKYSMAMGPYVSARLPSFNDNLAVKTVTLPMFQKRLTSEGLNNGTMAASMNNISFIKPTVSVLEAYYKGIDGFFTDNFPGAPFRFYDFVNGAPNNAPNDTSSMNGTRVKVLEYGTRVQMILQDTGTVTTENHPIHLHGYSFYVVGYGAGNYNPQTASLNLVDPPYMNTIGVPVGGWAAIRFVADNPGKTLMSKHVT
ncbi:hypothetical protein D5086_026046 [Populus alba]|uniref:Uncharacterized protein n=1 Tax=Populus alba TaxID=43335 RepID=A0ACC4B0T8_POPAL